MWIDRYLKQLNIAKSIQIYNNSMVLRKSVLHREWDYYWINLWL